MQLKTKENPDMLKW